MNKIVNINSTGKTLVCFGNSLTEGYMIEPQYSVPSRLQNWVTIPIKNHGVSGDTTVNALHRLDFAIREEPRIATVELGVNDIGWEYQVSRVRKNLSEIIERFQEAGAVVALAGFAFDNTEEWEAMFRELAETHGAVLIPNIYANLYGKSDLLFPDGLHPNEAGYAVMAENYYKAMQPLLEHMKIDKRAMKQ